MYEFHVSRLARDKFGFDQTLFATDGNVVFADFLAAHTFTQKINQHRDLANYPERAVRAGEINAIGLIDEILHMVFTLYKKQVDPKILSDALEDLMELLGEKQVTFMLTRFTEEFPPRAVYKDNLAVKEYLLGKTQGVPNQLIALEELIMLWVTNQNPAVSPFTELFDDTQLSQATVYRQTMESLQQFFKSKPVFGPDQQDLLTMLRSPAIAIPHSLSGQLEYIRKHWGELLGDYLYRLLNSLDLIREEEKGIFGGPGPTVVPSYDQNAFLDEENFSPDSDWMPRTVMIAKNTYVWLYQLSEQYHQEITRLDQIPDEELDKLASWGFNGLWLIGLWERSEASRTIKQLCGNLEAVASAYSLRNYAIANALGGEKAYQQLRERAWQRGIRLASDMVPNHMGIDSDWVLNHPDWFLSMPNSPFPSYSFNGTDLSPDERVGIFIEDHYYDRTDAAVVFKRVDKWSGDTRYIYHGNDGTSMPWNDTAQLDYLREDVREAVIQTILHVARKFPIIRFDAAMTLAKKHYQRLWFPSPGTGGAIPSRAEHGMTRAQFDEVFPMEFWREVVERVASEVPDTLLLAEAFWLMEGYFVRTLGMHRVYNSAFMNMLRNEENAKYRQLIKNTLEFDPQILKRYVNFMNNPDEKTAVEQFGKGDKYFGICTLMATMPGLPMFGHGQIEGYSEKYGMEFYRPYWEEEPDNFLIQRHEHDIFPILRRRLLFAGVENFLLYDFYSGEGRVDENVFAYSNGSGNQRGLVVYHNRFGTTRGWVKWSAGSLNKSSNQIESKPLIDGLRITTGPNRFVIFRDIHSGLEYIRPTEEIQNKGLYFELEAYGSRVFVDFREVEDNGDKQYRQLANYLNGRGVPSINGAIRELMLAPVLNPIRELINPQNLQDIFNARVIDPTVKLNPEILQVQAEKFRYLIQSVNGFVHGQQETEVIIEEMQAGLESILKLRIFETRYPFPGSKQYSKIIEYVQNNLVDYSFIWIVLVIWNDLRLLGRIITPDAQFAEISRSWLDEWGLSRHVDQTLQSMGFDADQAHSAVTILKLLVSQQEWTTQLEDETPAGLMEKWLCSQEIRSFLGINRYRDVLWFNKEAFESMLWWLMTIGLINQIAKPDLSLAEAVEHLFEAYALLKTILIAEEDSDYQVEKLLEGLK